jgi:hypothetical protein
MPWFSFTSQGAGTSSFRVGYIADNRFAAQIDLSKGRYHPLFGY